MKWYFLYLFIVLLTPFSKATAIEEETFVNLSLADGLAGETVRSIMTDHNGIVWIATSSGVTIFDGKNLQNYRILNSRGHMMEIYDLCETHDASVYAATEQGLYRLKLATVSFEHILPEVEHPFSLMAVGDTVYIGSEQGLQYWDGRKLHHRDIGASRQGLDNVVR